MSLFGRGKARQAPEAPPADEQAIARYRYMLKTAPPETLEQAHAEAFARLTPDQRRQLLQQMGDSVPAAERAAVEQGGASPQALARMATRAEVRQPGSLAGWMAGSFLSSIAGAVVGSMIAREFFSGQESDQAMGDNGGGSDDGGGFDTGGFDV